MTGIANTDQYEAWNGDSGQRWVADPDRRDRITAPVADALLDAADLRTGEAVLDVGCGCGATTLAAASAIAPDGSITGIDLSEPMLRVARERAHEAGVTNVAFIHGDAQAHEFTAAAFDVAISRFGTMFFADPVAAFTNIAPALRLGARLCVATWQPLAANDWLAVPGAALLRYGTLPDIAASAPGMFAQADPATVTRVLTDAGYHDVELQSVEVMLTLGADPADAAEHLADTGIGRAVLQTVPEHQRPDALDAVRTALAEHADAAGVHLGAAIWLITARPAAPRTAASPAG